jgi:hypothetical protein
MRCPRQGFGEFKQASFIVRERTSNQVTVHYRRKALLIDSLQLQEVTMGSDSVGALVER